MWFWCTPEEPVDDDKEEKVRGYWEDGLAAAPVVRVTKQNWDDEFDTEELDDQELAALGRVLARHQGPEARTRATRDFFAGRVKRPTPSPQKKEEVGSAAWRARLESVRAQLSTDKTKLARRQRQRASFLTDKPSMHDAQLRQKRSSRRLDELTKGGPRRPPTQRRVSFRDDDDDDDIEVKAAVDLHWKQVS